ncbi:hypothetical protein, partial [Acetobacter fallax]
CARVISVQAILISSGYRKPMNHNPLKSLNSFSVRHLQKQAMFDVRKPSDDQPTRRRPYWILPTEAQLL